MKRLATIIVVSCITLYGAWQLGQFVNQMFAHLEKGLVR